MLLVGSKRGLTCRERCVNLGFVIFLSEVKSLKYVNKLEFVLLRELINQFQLSLCFMYSS